jgi:hypothetical protein
MRYARTAAIVAVVTLVTSGPARAQLGDGTCTAAEAQSQQCAVLGPNALEIVPANGEFPVVGTCQGTGGPVTCAFWPYRFSGPSGDNQLTVLIPATLDVFLNQVYPPTNTAFTGCQQIYDPGQGDPNGAFGKGLIAYKACRLAFNFDIGPGTPNLVLATSLAQPGPMPVQQKTGRNFFFEDLLGPATAGVPRLTSTLEEINARGAVLTVETNQVGALVSATANTGPVRIIPPGFAVLCTPFDPTNAYPNNFPSQYDCGPIVENLDGKNLQAGLNSTCYYRRSDGSLLAYCCCKSGGTGCCR